MIASVNVDIDLDDIDFDDMCDYIESQGYEVVETKERKNNVLLDEMDCDAASSPEELGSSMAAVIREHHYDTYRTYMRALIAGLTNCPKSTDVDTLLERMRDLL